MSHGGVASPYSQRPLIEIHLAYYRSTVTARSTPFFISGYCSRSMFNWQDGIAQPAPALTLQLRRGCVQ